VGSNTVWCKATGTDSEGASIKPPAGTATLPTRTIGYTSSCGDGGLFTIAATAGITNGFDGTNGHQLARNLIYDSNGQSVTFVWKWQGNNVAVNCQALHVATNNQGFSLANFDVCERCYATPAVSATSTTGFSNSVSVGPSFTDCVADGAFLQGFAAGGRVSLVRCIARNAVTGFANMDQSLVLNCVADACTAGLSASSSFNGASVRNCVFRNCTTGFNGGATLITDWDADYNFFFGCTTNRTNVPAGAHDVILTADPFASASGGDYSLNGTAGGGAAVKGAGYPGAFPGIATTGHLDGGAAQSPGGGGVSLLYLAGMEGGMIG
jgi:hypothetical protein